VTADLAFARAKPETADGGELPALARDRLDPQDSCYGTRAAAPRAARISTRHPCRASIIWVCTPEVSTR